MSLKGLREKFVAGIFTQIRPVWIGELENRPKTSKNLRLGPYIFIFGSEIFLGKSATVEFSYVEKKVVLDSVPDA